MGYFIMLLSEFFSSVYRPLRLRGKSAASTRLYGCLLRSFDRFLLRRGEVSDLDDLTIAAYLERRADAGRSPYTIERERCGLLALARLARERGLLAVMPSCPQGALPERVPQAWTVEQLRTLIAAAEAQPGMVGAVPAGLWWSTLLLVLYQTGERITAIVDTPAANYRRPHLLVTAECRKGKKRDRVYELSADVCDLIERMALDTTGQGKLFPWPLCRTYLWGRMKKMVRAAGLGEGRSFRFHGVRRAALSHYAAAGGDAAAMADHASPRTTARWYLDPRITNTGPRPCDVLPRIDARIMPRQ
jgi:integrase